MYFSGQGKLYIATRQTSGQPGAFRYVGNCSQLKIQLSVDKIQHHESVTGQRLLDFQMVKENKCDIDFTLDEFEQNNLAMALYGTAVAATPGTATAETFYGTVAQGDYIRLKNQNVSALVITDSTATPKTAVLGTDYAITNAEAGTINWLSNPATGGFTQPFKAAYTYTGAENNLMFSQPVPERWLRFEGMNTADTVNHSQVLVEVYRILLDPMKQFDVINDDLAKFELSGSALYDPLAGVDPSLGFFGRVMQLGTPAIIT